MSVLLCHHLAIKAFHADETKVALKGGGGYVLAFTNLEEVVYVYTETREGTILDHILEGFEGF